MEQSVGSTMLLTFRYVRITQLQHNNNEILLRLIEKNEEQYDSVRKKHFDLAKILVKISEQQVQIVSTIKGLKNTEKDG